MKKKNANQTPNQRIKDTGSAPGKNTPVAPEKIHMLPIVALALVIGLVPLITIAHVYDPGLNIFPWFDDGNAACDVFLFYKGLALVIISAFLLILAAKSFIQKRNPFAREKRSIPPVVAAGLFALLCLLSASLSDHASDAFWGGYIQFEGLFVLVSYVICFYSAYGWVDSEKAVRLLLDALMISAFIIGLLGTLEFFGLDWYETPLAQGLMSPELKARGIKEGIVASFSGPSTATLYNPNYVGSYVPLILPFVVYRIVRNEKLWKRVFAGVTAVLLILSLRGSDSDTGLIAAGACLVAAVVFLLPLLKKNVRIIIAIASVVVIAGGGWFLASRGILENMTQSNDAYTIEDMKTDKNSIEIHTGSGKVLEVSLPQDLLTESGWATAYPIFVVLSVVDKETGNEVPFIVDENDHAVINDENYEPVHFYLDTGVIPAESSGDGIEHIYDRFHVSDGSHDFEFGATSDGEIRYRTGTGKYTSLDIVDRQGFEGKYSAFSGRGYLWACTIPKLMDCILAGTGPDNYIYTFPNDDFVGKQNSGYGEMIVSRPHDMYMQIWVQDGLIALIAFLALYGIFIVRVVMMCYRRRKGLNEGDIGRTRGITAQGVAVAAAIGTTAYMVAGLANDSIVCVAPVFWVMLGVGYAAERMWRRELIASGGGDMPETVLK